MNILVPLNNKSYINQYIEAGADEFYIGFNDDRWCQQFGAFCDINRMSGFGKYANKYTFDEVLEIIAEIKKRKKRIFVTLNANVYGKNQIAYIETYYLPQLQALNVDGIICSDIPLSLCVLKNNIPVIASTMMAIYNEDIANFYFNKGIKRMILPRDLSLNEIEEICKSNPQIEYETFFLRNGCVYSDCYCLGTHRISNGSTCGYLKNHSKTIILNNGNFNENNLVGYNDTLYNTYFHRDTCGMCALYRMMKIGIKSLKIVGRADQEELVLEDIRLTKHNIECALSVANENEYLIKMKMPDRYEIKCQMGLCCYYPEIRFGDTV